MPRQTASQKQHACSQGRGTVNPPRIIGKPPAEKELREREKGTRRRKSLREEVLPEYSEFRNFLGGNDERNMEQGRRARRNVYT